MVQLLVRTLLIQVGERNKCEREKQVRKREREKQVEQELVDRVAQKAF